MSIHTRIRRQWRPTHLHVRSPQPHPQPQPDTSPNLVLGPGGQASIVSIQDNPQLPQAPAAVVPQNQSPPQLQSVAGSSGTPPASPSNQPVQTISLSQPPLIVPSSATTQSAIVTATSTPSAPTSWTTVTESTTAATTTSSDPSTATASSSPPSSTLATSVVAIAASNTSDSTSTPTVSPSSTPSNLTSHSPPFYVGIVLGTIVIIACLCALIAWWVRLRSHAKRRRTLGSANVPWGKPDTDDGGLEGGRETSFVGAGLASIGDMGLGTQEDIGAQGHPWEPQGDRDVGEPKRTESFLHTPISPVKRTIPLDPFSDAPTYFTTPNQRSSLADSAAYPLPLRNGPYPTTRPLPSHLTGADFGASGSADDHGSACTLGPLQVANMMPGDASAASSRAGTAMGMSSVNAHAMTNEFGTPRENVAGSRPRFLGLDGQGLKVPWEPVPGLGTVSSRLRGRGGNWEHLPPLPMPGESPRGRASGPDTEGWTASLKMNLVNAFNSVAANLPSASNLSGEEEDKLTPMPIRRGADRRSLRGKDWVEFVGGELVGLPLSRGSTVSSRVSKAWTLEETGDGAGVVHIRGLGLESYRGGDHAFSPQLSRGSSLSSDDRDTIRFGTGGDILRVMTHESQTPLIITKKPKAVFLKPNPRRGMSWYGGGGGTGTLTRASSVYSTASAVSSVFMSGGGGGSGPPRLPNIPSFSRTSTVTARSRYGGSEKSAKIGRKRPKNLSHLSSSSSSAASFRSDVSRGMGMDKLSDREEAAKRAMRERRMKVMKTGKFKGRIPLRNDDLRA